MLTLTRSPVISVTVDVALPAPSTPTPVAVGSAAVRPVAAGGGVAAAGGGKATGTTSAKTRPIATSRPRIGFPLHALGPMSPHRQEFISVDDSGSNPPASPRLLCVTRLGRRADAVALI